ncbi:NADPH-dependent F420 reductase [Arthrobacter sp. MA-N2]|uniref:NADPH-dependent F420 reductase n=1 Tax=Arthrobacter sp. MA-N2 TaxID=1101188 RepID=UPI0004891FD0|nr:NAD(P)-binding domain-containing protein [Arthrobacter sp. MA-N2]
MTDITIIGSGNMGRGIGTRAVAAGRSVQVLDKSAEEAQKLAAELGSGATGAASTEAPAGRIVVLALPFDAAKEVVSGYGDALDGRIIIDISNPVNYETFDSLVVGPGTSAAEEIAKLARNEVADFVTAAGLRPLQVGGLHHARELEGFQLLLMALQANPAYESFNWGTALKILG